MEPIYHHTARIYNTNAAEVIVPILLQDITCKSVLDVGCGIGSWLKVFTDHGVSDILGLDGSYVDRSKLLIIDAQFRALNLAEPFDLKRTFDVVLCLEVAEHLPQSSADMFIQHLCNHGETIVFSAAIPGQGGQSHLNEQWPDYWQKKFRSLGYKRLDIIRPAVWNNKDVDIWYRQNIFVYSKNKTLIEKDPGEQINAEIHPDLWQLKIRALEDLRAEINAFDRGGAGVARSFKALINAIKHRL